VTRAAPKGGRWHLRAGERLIVLLLGDMLAASLATLGALILWSERDWLGFTPEFIRSRASWFVLLPLLWALLMVNLYDVRRAASWRESRRGVLLAAGVGLGLYLIVYFSLEGTLARRGVAYFLGLVVPLTLLWRALYVRIFTAPAFLRRVVIAGAGLSGRTLLGVVHSASPSPFHLVGLIDDDPAKHGQTIEGAPVLGDSSHLLEIVEQEEVSEVIVAITGKMQGAMFQALLDAQERGVEVSRMPVVYEELLSRVPIRHLESDWLLRSFVDELRVSGVYLLVKRLIDILGALAGLLGFLIVLPWVALGILVESGRPVFFRQLRLGQGGKCYSVLKLRTMRQDAEADGQAHWAREGDPRTTRVGNLLRRMHLDEFPQFWNVLKGEMSLVGPRPERPELVAELEQQIPFYRARLLVKPGVSGWAQINYGKGASVEGSAEKLEYDLYYIKHRGLWMDIWIVLRSIGSVFGLRGV
jgi:exopolysaccharide biosynthesis polyprenyl glycosylphosphotransferase